jgi:hypothetical protein
VLGGRREILDVGEENGELLALGVDLDVTLPGEDRFIDLGAQVLRYLHRHRGQEVVGAREFLVHHPDLVRLAALHDDDADARCRREGEVDQEILEAPDADDHGMADRHGLDAANVADLPVAFGAVGVAVMTADAAFGHADREGHLHDGVEQAAGRVFAARKRGIGAEGVERGALEFRQRVRLAAREGEIGHEVVADGAVAAGDEIADRDREGRRDRHRAGNVVVILYHLRRPAIRPGRENAADDVGRVKAADVGDDRADIERLPARGALGQVAQVEPDRNRQGRKQERHDCKERPGAARLLNRTGNLAAVHDYPSSRGW